MAITSLMAITWSNHNEFSKSSYHSIEWLKSYRMIPKSHIFNLYMLSNSQKIAENSKIWVTNFPIVLRNNFAWKKGTHKHKKKETKAVLRPAPPKPIEQCSTSGRGPKSNSSKSKTSCCATHFHAAPGTLDQKSPSLGFGRGMGTEEIA